MRARALRLLAAFALSLSLLGGGLAASVVTAEPAEARSMSLKEQRRAIVKKTNKIRKQHGCRALRLRSKLNLAAQRHARDMSRKDYFSHTSANGRSWVSRIRRAGWRNPAGENIARGYSSAGSVVSAWMHSPGHRRNILNCQFRYIGVGFERSGHYWVQDFGY